MIISIVILFIVSIYFPLNYYLYDYNKNNLHFRFAINDTFTRFGFEVEHRKILFSEEGEEYPAEFTIRLYLFNALIIIGIVY